MLKLQSDVGRSRDPLSLGMELGNKKPRASKAVVTFIAIHTHTYIYIYTKLQLTRHIGHYDPFLSVTGSDENRRYRR